MSMKATKPGPLLPPGTYIEEWMEEHPQITQSDVAKSLEISTGHLGQVINGDEPISQDLATRLAALTGYSKEFWLTYQARYEARKVVTHQNTRQVKES